MSAAGLRHQTSQDETDIRALIESIHLAHRTKDAAAIAARYSDNAELFTLAPPLARQGVDSSEMKAWPDSWEGPIERESRGFDVTVSGDSVFAHGFYRMSGTPKTAGQHIRFWMRATVCVQRSEGTWHIVHEHTSVPFYMDGSLRPAFDLEPKEEI